MTAVMIAMTHCVISVKMMMNTHTVWTAGALCAAAATMKATMMIVKNMIAPIAEIRAVIVMSAHTVITRHDSATLCVAAAEKIHARCRLMVVKIQTTILFVSFVKKKAIAHCATLLQEVSAGLMGLRAACAKKLHYVMTAAQRWRRAVNTVAAAGVSVLKTATHTESACAVKRKC